MGNSCGEGKDMKKDDYCDLIELARAYIGGMIIIPLIGMYLGWFGVTARIL